MNNLQKNHIAKLHSMENEMRKFEQVEISVKHYFAPGCYAREMFVPAGVMLTGKIHRFGHLNIMSKGKMTLVTEEGRQVVEAPFTFISEPGAKRAFYAHEDSVWTTIHPTDETDLEKLEEMLLIPESEVQKCLG